MPKKRRTRGGSDDSDADVVDLAVLDPEDADVIVPGMDYVPPCRRVIPKLPPTGCVGLAHDDRRRGEAMVHANTVIVNYIMLDIERGSTYAAAPFMRVPFWDETSAAWHWFALNSPWLFQGFCTWEERELLIGCLRHVMVEDAKAATHAHRVKTALRPGSALAFTWGTPVVPPDPNLGGLFRATERYTRHATECARREEEQKRARKKKNKPTD